MADPTPANPHDCHYALAICEALRQPLLVLSADLHVLWSNRSFHSTFHTVPAQVEGRRLFELGQQGDSSSLRELLTGPCTAGHRPQAGETTVEFDLFGRRTFLREVQPLCVDGEAGAILLILDCGAERKSSEKALIDSEHRYRRLFEAAQDGILLLDAHTGEIVDANPFLERLLGYTQREMVGRRLWELGPFQDVAAAQASFKTLQYQRYIRYEDLPLQTKDGRRIDVEFVSNIYAVDGEQTIQCNIRDITDRKQAEGELHALRLALEERVTERTAELSHTTLALQEEVVERRKAEEQIHRIVVEERTRIARELHDTLAQGFTGIIIHLEVAEDALPSQPELASLHVGRARNLARDSLSEARHSVWSLRPAAPQTPDLGSALAQFVGSIGSRTTTAIELSRRGVLPRLSSELAHHLLRIGQEAITNSLRHAQATEIRIELNCAEDRLELRVEDNGIGFAVDHAAGWHGLGLRGLHERVTLLGGEVAIVSLPEEGTRVRVEVPLAREGGGHLGEEQLDPDYHRG